MVSSADNPNKPSILARTPGDWHAQMRDALVEPRALLDFLGLDCHSGHLASPEASGFRMRVPLAYAALMRRGDAADPLLRQVLPLAEELDIQPGFGPDPVGDGQARITTGVLRKYQGRALLMVTGACPINCRYCFRRCYPHDAGLLSGQALDQAMAYLHADAGIHEVILSGGDPLVADDRRLAELLGRLARLPQLRRLRIHSRMAVVIPARITPELLEQLAAFPRPTCLVLHCNHAQEISPELAAALAQLRAAGVSLLNQAVLLRGVNDSQGQLAALSEQLFELGVMPYYLHLLDRVAGAAHFEVPEAQARQLIAALRDQLPGYLVPRLVRELAGAASKTPL